jgi:lysophospholipase L1-like esterase
MDELYEYTDRLYDTLTGREPQRWDFAAHKTDIVIVNLGTNDVNPIRFYNELGKADEEERHFYERYTAFIKQLRRCNGPSALICCTLGPLDYYLYDVIRQAVTDYVNESGDERVRCFKLIGVNLMTEGFGAIGHPSALTHARIGNELAARLKDLI